jgi:GNAT superfamily N-acetyltransferase
VDRVVRSAGRQDIRPAAVLLARSFTKDPLYAWIFPDERARARRLPSLFAAQLNAARRGRDEIDVMAAGAQVLGCAVWSPPGAVRPSAGQQLTVLTAFPRILGRRLPVALGSFNAIGRARPAEPHQYLSTIGVDPPVQRTGVAKGLLRPRLARCDEDGVPVALVTGEESNVAYYESLGFAVTGQVELPSGGPAQWTMWRRPRP